jgi:putative ABC transport system ATP-binding protein
MAQSVPLLSIENLSRKLSQRWIWQGVRFELRGGNCVGLIGASGTGKTLLLRSLVALDPIDRGKIRFKGRSLENWSVPAYRTQVVYLPQRPAQFEGTVESNLQQVFQFAAHRQNEYSRKQIEQYLDILGRSSDFLQLSAPQLSGGEGQILALLRALQLKPTILLLDEPTASLDLDTTMKVEQLLTDWLASEVERGLLWTSHDSKQIERVTTRQIYLSEFTA